MLETSEERIKLLRAGFTSKEIEKLYIESNNFKIVRIPILIELCEIDTPPDKKTCINHAVTVKRVNLSAKIELIFKSSSDSSGSPQ